MDPVTKTVWRGRYKSPLTGGHHRLDFDTEQEAVDYGLGPGSAGIISIEPVEVPDPAWVAARKAEAERIWRTSCMLPPPEDLLLLREARKTLPRDWESIDPSRGIWKETRNKLHGIRSLKYNQHLQQLPTHTP